MSVALAAIGRQRCPPNVERPLWMAFSRRVARRAIPADRIAPDAFASAPVVGRRLRRRARVPPMAHAGATLRWRPRRLTKLAGTCGRFGRG